MKKSDIKFEIQFFEGVLEKKPDFISALTALGDLYTKNREYEKGLRIDLKLTLLCPDDPYVYYNLACSYSLLHDIPEAINAITTAFKLGYDDFDFFKNDPDLENLRKDRRFKNIYSKIKHA